MQLPSTVSCLSRDVNGWKEEMHVGSRQSHSFAAPARVPTCQAKDSVRISHQDAGFVIWNDPRLCAPRELNFVSRAQLSSTPLPPMPCKIMALLANAAAAAAPAALSRLSTRSPSLLTHSNSAAAACFSARSSTFGSSSVFGHRLLASLLGLTLGNSASSTAVRGMETVSASAAQVKSGSSIYDFVVKVWSLTFRFLLLFIVWLSGQVLLVDDATWQLVGFLHVGFWGFWWRYNACLSVSVAGCELIIGIRCSFTR